MTDFPHPAAFRRPHRRSTLEIRRAAATGIYDIRGGGTKRKLPHFDDLLFLGASISAIRWKATARSAHRRLARHPLRQEADHLDIPITIAGMSFGALSGPPRKRWAVAPPSPAPRPPPATAA
jgi:glutamate synthase domain-containing protein 2